MKALLLLLGIAVIARSVSIANPQTNLNQNQPVASEAQPQELNSFMEIKEESTQNVNAWFDISGAEAATDTKIQDALLYGIQNVINKAIQDKKVSVSEFTVTEVKRIQRQTTGSGVNYRFEVTLDNGKGTSLWTYFTVSVTDSNQTKSLKEFTYQVKGPLVQTQTQTVVQTQTRIEPVEQDYILVDSQAATSDADLQASLQYGLGQVVAKVKAEGKTDPNFDTADVTKTEEQTVQGLYTFYRFSVDLTNAKSNVTASFVILFNEQTHENKVWSLLYKVAIKETTSVVIPTTPDGFTKIELYDVQNNGIIKANLEFGVSKVIEKALQDKKIPIAVYSVSEIKSAEKGMVGEIAFYRFNVVLANGAGTIVEANFTVKYNTARVTRELSGFSYSARTTTTTTR